MAQWVFNAVIHSIIIIGIPIGFNQAYKGASWQQDGTDDDLYFFGICVYSIMIACLNVKVIIYIYSNI